MIRLQRAGFRWAVSLLVVVALLAGLMRDAAGAIALGNAGGTQGTGVSSLTWSHTVAAGSDRLLIVRVANIDATVSVSSVTYGGVALTLLQSSTSGSGTSHARASVWYRVAPTVGTANVVVTLSGSTRAQGYSNNLTGVSQTTPLGATTTATGTNNVISVTAAGAAGDLMMDTAAAQGGAGTATAGAGQTAVSGSTGPTANDVLGMGSTKAGAASVTLTWSTTASSPWVSIGVAIKQATGYTVSGTVFEDRNYGGGAGRTLAASGGAGVSGATVELYNSSGSYLSSTTTAAGGTYSFANLTAATYYVRVVSSSVGSTRSGSTAALRAVLTYRSNASSGTAVAVTDHVGGTNPALVDPGAASGGAAFNTSTFVYGAGLSGTAQAVSPVTVSSANIGSVDFGFNFDTVVSTRNSGQGSLAQAVVNANTLSGDASLAVTGRTAGVEHVVFMIPNGTTGAGGSLGLAAGGLRSSLNAFSGGVATITPGASLVVSAPLVIDAQTQPGWTANPIVELVGTGAASGSHGLDIGAGPTTVRGLVINRWPAIGLNAWAGSGHVIQGNWMGLNNAGTGASANGTEGVNLWSTTNTTVGGTTASARNVLSGNGNNGLVITGPSNGTTVRGNYIGTNAAGTAAVANGSLGVYVSTPAIVIGGTAAGAGNVIGGNTYAGLFLDAGADGTTVQGNFIGTNPAGTAAVPNGGIAVDIYSANNSIGGTTAAARNLISGNGYAGVYVSGTSATGNVIQGNYIGTTASGSAALPNAGEGVVIESAGNTVGGSVAGAGNLISGNTQFGVAVRNSSASNNTVRGNTIGLNAAGNAALSNGSFGVVIDFLAPGTQIIGNVISGNTNAGWSAAQGGIYLYAGATTVRGNTIGMDAAGTTAIGNGRAVANSGGIYVNGGSTGITIGGTASGEGNLIGGNIGDGILTDVSAVQASILGNTFRLNTQLGIDLLNDGVTANDGVKTTGQANRLIDHPVFTTATLSGTTLTVAGYVGSAAGQSVFANSRVEVFIADTTAAGNGEGQTYLGFVTTDASGNFSGSITGVTGVTLGTTRITGTATDTSNYTSEFGANVVVSSALSISGTVFEDLNYGGGAGRSRAASGGVGLGGATVELYDVSGGLVASTTTASDGSYSFTGALEKGYLVRVVQSSVRSSRSGSTAALLPVQTWRYESSWLTPAAVTDEVGGARPDQTDGAAATALTWTTCAFESGGSGNACTFTGTHVVRYGADTRWTARVATGGVTCSNAVFGDPAVGTAKTCQVLDPHFHSASSVHPTSTSVSGVDFGFNFDTVSNTNDSGPGSLRQAITNANTLGGDASLAQSGRTAGVEHLVFMISNGTSAAGLRSGNNLFSGGVASIAPVAELPAVTSRLVLDAQTQPGWSLAPHIELNGAGAGSASGLVVNAASSVVRGFVINRFSNEGLTSSAGAGLVIQGNYIGVNAAGTAASANGGSAIWLNSNAGGHQIGGTSAAQRNVLSGQTTFQGIAILGGSGSVIQGNFIGSDAGGASAVGNGADGIYLYGGVSNTSVGGTGAGAGNLIRGNAGRGVRIAAGSTGNAILGNSIHGNANIGIDLNANGISANDGAKTVGAANLLMDAPVFTSARARGSQLTLSGYIGTAAGQSAFAASRVEVFVSDSGSTHGSGQTYLGALTADGSGNFSGTITMPFSALRAGSVLTGTATDTSNNTSEFGANFSGLVVDWVINHNGDGVDANPGDGLCETSTPGQCTLRAAIMEANAWAGADVAVFDLPSCPGAGCVITPASALPAISGQLTIDGQTQPGWTLAPLVDLRGESAGAGSDGLTVNAAGSIVRGLAVGGFLQSGIRINASNVTVEGVYAGIAPDGSTTRANGASNSMTGGVYVAAGTGIVIGGAGAAQRNVLSGNGGAGVWVNAGTVSIMGNYVGTDAAGTAARGNGRWGVVLESGSGHRLGGPAAGEGNVVAGNVGNSKGGILVVSASTVTIQGNTIGLNAARTVALPNGDGSTTFASGIDLRNTSSGHLIGGTAAGEGNVIAGNAGHGVRVISTTTRILGNAIYNNLWLGIDLNGDGVTANNGTQSGALPNNDMDHPVITSAGYDPLTRALTLTGYVGTGTGQALFAGARIELFTSDGDSTGYGEGSAFVGTLTADANGRFSGTVSVPVSVTFAVGTALTGTATDTANNTSEFGPNVVTTTTGALAPSRFNAFETSTVGGALTGVIQTRVAGVAGSIAIIAIDNSGSALQTSFAGTVTLDWMNATDNSGALDAGNCRASWVAAGSAGSAAFVAGDLGRHTSTITPATVGREWRLRISYAGPGGTVTSCSTDAFAVRPDTLAITGVTDADDATAGTTRALDNLAATGGRVHRAGRPFSLRAAARDAASAVTTGYTGTPTLAITDCVLPAGCTAGTLTVPTLTASAGLVASDTLSYSEVGAINVQLTDDSFADIDAADTLLAQRRIQSAIVGVGRFVPDRYLLAAATPPQFATQQGSCAAAGQGFTFVGQNFGWATPPSFTVTAQNAAGATTTLWSGALQKLTTAHVARSLAAANAQGLTPAVSWGTMTLTDAGDGVAGVALSGDQFLFPRDAGAPVASFDPLITLGLAVSDVSEVAVSGNSAVAGTAALVIGSGTGIAFNHGSRFHYARLKLQNAFGDARRGVRANVELQKYTDRGWLRLSEDDHCITVPQPAIAFGAGSGAFSTDLCTAPASAAIVLRQGRGTLVLPKTAGNLQGAAMVTLNIGPVLEGNACAAGMPVTPVSAALPHLLGARGVGTTQDQNPAARLVWGRQHRDYMVQRELF